MSYLTLDSSGQLRTAFVALALFAMVLCSVVLPAEEKADIPRRPDGRPDLSGTYDTATLTPVQRPDRYGDRLSLTDQEAKAIADHWAASFEKDYAPSDPNREAPPEGGTGIYAPEFTGAAGKVGGYNAGFVDIGDSAFKLDGKWRTSIITDPPNGKYPAPSADGKKRREETAVYRHENTGTAWWDGMDYGPYDDPELRPTAERCLLARGASGPPSLPSMYNNIKRIVQTDTHVMMGIEWMHDVRVIRLEDQHSPEDIVQWSGDSVGHWEGDTLVVHTKGFREDTAASSTFVDREVEERFSRIDKETLLYEFTVNDPNLSEPWSGEYPWPQTENMMYEYACHEGNYALGGILRGARILEKDVQDAKAAGSSPTDRD